MSRLFTCVLLMCASLALAQQTTSPAPPAPKLTLPYNPGRPTPPPAPSFGNGIDYHNGPIMPRINVYYIFYGSWRGDDAVTHLENVARNIGGTYWWNINSTYTDTTGARAGPAIFHAGSIFDESLSAGNTLTTQGIRDVVSSAILQRRLPLDESALYVVAASAGVTVPGLCTEFCGWHTAGWVTQDGATRTVKLAFVGDTRKCPSACGAQTLTPNNSVAADGMVSVFAHELAEAATDPEINAWYDSNGLENADKCSWMFGTTSRAPNGAGTNIVLGAYRYLIQQNWVNAGGGYCAMQYGGPAVTGMNPASGAAGSAISVTIRGTNFEPGVTLEPSGTGLTVTDLRLASSNELTATITAAAGAEAGVREMRLVQRGAEYLLSFAVTQALPVLTSVTPSEGRAGSTADLTLAGANFGADATPRVSGPGVTVSSFTRASATRINARVSIDGAAAPGVRQVTIVSGSAVSAAASFTVREALPTQPPALVSVSPASGSGLQQTFTINVSEPSGVANLRLVTLAVDSFVRGGNSCVVNVNVQERRASLLNDAGTSWANGAMGSTDVLGNSQCSVSLAGLTLTPASGTAAVVAVPVTFNASYRGEKSLILNANNTALLETGFRVMGSYTVQTPLPTLPPSITAISPGSGAGLAQTFTVTVAEPSGAANLRLVTLAIDNFIRGASSCVVNVVVQERRASLLNDLGDAWSGGAVGGTGSVANSQCSVNLAALRLTQTSATTVAVELPITFQASYAGNKSLIANANNTALLESGFRVMGSYAVQEALPAAPPAVVSVSPNSGSGFSQTFTVHVAEPSGAANLRLVTLVIDTFVRGANSCVVNVNVRERRAALLNDAGTGWTSGTAGGSGVLGNTQCSVSLASLSLTQTTGTIVAVDVPVTFSAGYQGTKSLILNANNTALLETGFRVMGSYSVQQPLPTQPPSIVSLAPNTGGGLSQTFIAAVSEPSGAANLRLITLAIDSFVRGANSCVINVVVQEGSASLLNDAGTAWSSGAAGSSRTLANSQCSLNLAGFRLTQTNSTTVTVELPVTFQASYAGNKSLIMNANNTALLETGFRVMGAYNVQASLPTQPPAVVSISPSSGTGITQTFTLVIAEPSGAANLRLVTLAVDTFVRGANSCVVNIVVQERRAALLNDAGTAWTSGGVGAAGTLTNSQCSLNLSGVRLTQTSSTVFTLDVPVSFRPAFSGTKSLILNANNTALLETGFRTLGSYTIPSTPLTPR